MWSSNIYQNTHFLLQLLARFNSNVNDTEFLNLSCWCFRLLFFTGCLQNDLLKIKNSPNHHTTSLNIHTLSQTSKTPWECILKVQFSSGLQWYCFIYSGGNLFIVVVFCLQWCYLINLKKVRDPQLVLETATFCKILLKTCNWKLRFNWLFFQPKIK